MVRVRYTKKDNRLESKPIVIGVTAHHVVIDETNSVWILDNDTMQVYRKTVPWDSLSRAKKEAKAMLLDMGATFNEESRNRSLTKKK